MQASISDSAAARRGPATGRPLTACARESRRLPARAIWRAPRSGCLRPVPGASAAAAD